MGTPEISCRSLEQIHGDNRFQILAVVTQPDRPGGRELKLSSPSVKVLAQKFNLPILQPQKARDNGFIGELRALKPDLIVVVAYGQILPQELLDVPACGCLNVHASLLPKYRGAAPIQWAIANGDVETGVTIMKMDSGLDTGPILAMHRTRIFPEDDSQSLHDRLAQMGAQLLLATIPDYVSGKIPPRPQPAEGATYAAKIKKEDGLIDWRLPAGKIVDRLRAFAPWPGAYSFFGVAGSVPVLIKTWKAAIVGKSGRPGEVLSASRDGLIVACGADAIQIFELQREGGRRLTTEQFLAGFPIKAGERFMTRPGCG